MGTTCTGGTNEQTPYRNVLPEGPTLRKCVIS